MPWAGALDSLGGALDVLGGALDVLGGVLDALGGVLDVLGDVLGVDVLDVRLLRILDVLGGWAPSAFHHQGRPRGPQGSFAWP